MYSEMVSDTKQRTTLSWRCASPTPTWSPPPSARSPSTSAWKTRSGFPWSAARVRDTLVKSVSTSQTSSLVLPVKVRIALLARLACVLLFHSLFLWLLFSSPWPIFPPAHHNVYGAFSLEICLRFPSLLPKPACQGQSLSLCWFQGKGKTCVESN